MKKPGVFIAVVGPSGSGKDTILRGAMDRFAGHENVVFPRRIISRPADDANEDHIATTKDAFAVAEAAGAFLLSWRAHDLCYAVPASAGSALDAGRVVVANLSRAALNRLDQTVVQLRTVVIQADPHTIRQRLLARRRETPVEIEARMGRTPEIPLKRENTITIENNGAPGIAIDKLCAVIESVL